MKTLRYSTRSTQCSTCIFRDNQAVTPQRMTEIREYLIAGTTHICHHSKDKACRGGRQYQAVMWYRLGIIKYPTIKALETEALKQLNSKNNDHN
jgi:hypothetical protein